MLTKLIMKERIITTYAQAKAIARLADRMIDVAKEGNEPLLYSWMYRKELIPRVFEDLMPRYDGPTGGKYTQIFRLHSQDKYHNHGDAVVEFIGNGLPPLLPTEEELKEMAIQRWKEEKAQEMPLSGTAV